MDITIRKAVTADIDFLSEMLSQLFSIEDDFTADPAKQKKGLEMIITGGTERIIYVAESDSHARGMVSLQKIISTAAGGYSVLLEDLYVVPGFRNRGVGKMLLKTAFQWGKEQQALRIQLAADARNSTAAAFYADQGFQISSMVFHYKFI